MARYNPDPDNLSSHHSPVYSEPTIATSAFLPYAGLYQPTTYSGGGSSYFSPASSLFSVPDIKPRRSPMYVNLHISKYLTNTVPSLCTRN